MDEVTASNAQKAAYDLAYGAAQAVAFPDHKIEGPGSLRGQRIVSVGGGTGADVAHLTADNEVHVFDFSESPRPIAEAFGARFHVIDLSHPGVRLPFEDGSVGVVVAKDILEHLSAPELLMTEIRRVLRPDGYLVLSIPNHFNLWGRIRIFLGRNLIWKGILHDHTRVYEEWNYMHVRFFTWKGLRKFLNGSGFSVSRTYFDFGPFGHYFSIPMLAEHLRLKEQKAALTRKGRAFLKTVVPAYRAASALFPGRARNAACAIAPSLMTSCFYLHAVRSKDSPDA